MTFWKPLIAALIAAALFGAYIVDRNQRIAAEKSNVDAGRIMPFDFAGSTRLTINGENGRFVVEKQDDGIWYLVEPVRHRADEDRIQTIIDNVHASKKSNPFPARDLDEYGLDPAEASITIEGIDTRNGQPHTATVLIGTNAPRLSRVYAMVEGENVIFTALETLRNQSRVKLDDLRDRRLIHFSPDATTALEIGLPSGPFTIARDESGRWMMEDGTTPANRTMVEAALNQLAQLRVLRVLDGEEKPSPEETGLDEPSAMSVSVTTDQGKSSITIGKRAPGEELFFATGDSLEGGVGIVRVRDVSTFIQPRSEWVTPRFLWARPDEIEMLEIHFSTSKFVVERGADGVWRFEDQPDSPVHPGRIERLLENLGSLVGKQLVASSVTRDQMRELFGVRDESSQLFAIMPDGRTEGYIMGRTVPSELTQYLVRIQDNSVWTIDMGTMHLYIADRSDLRDNRIRHGFAANVARVVFSTDRGAIELSKETRAWRLNLAGGRRQVIPDHLVEQFLTASEELSRSAEVYTATAPPIEFRVRYEDANGSVLHELAVHQREEDSSSIYVTADGVLYELITESYVRFQKASDDLVLTGQQLSEQQK